MDAVSEAPQRQQSSDDAPVLQVDFSWKKFRALVTARDNPSDPLYIVHFQSVKSPHLIVKSADDKDIVGSGTLHPISINSRFEVNGQKGTLKALRRWHTEYTHLSYAFSDNDTPVTMRWTSAYGFKTWDFICMDEQQMPVAKFSANAWSARKLGNIEFLGPKANLTVVRDEIVVTGLTLFYCMLLRSTSLLSFFGAIVARPGPIKDAPKNSNNQCEHDEASMPGIEEMERNDGLITGNR